MGKKVIVTDDDPVVRLLVTEFLSSQGYEVKALDSGAKCLDVLKSEVPDILMLDLIMPDMTGFDIVSAVRNNPATKSVPIIMLSANTNTESVAKEYEVEANAFLQKPFDLKSIMEAVRKALGEGE